MTALSFFTKLRSIAAIGYSYISTMMALYIFLILMDLSIQMTNSNSLILVSRMLLECAKIIFTISFSLTKFIITTLTINLPTLIFTLVDYGVALGTSFEI